MSATPQDRRLREKPFNLEELRARSKRWNTTCYDTERCIEEIDRLRALLGASRPPTTQPMKAAFMEGFSMGSGGLYADQAAKEAWQRSQTRNEPDQMPVEETLQHAAERIVTEADVPGASRRGRLREAIYKELVAAESRSRAVPAEAQTGPPSQEPNRKTTKI